MLKKLWFPLEKRKVSAILNLQRFRLIMKSGIFKVILMIVKLKRRLELVYLHSFKRGKLINFSQTFKQIFLILWFQVMDPSYLIHYRDMYHTHGLITTSLGLNIPVDGRHFFDGIMRVKCVASLSPSLWQNGRESIVHRRPSLMDSREAMLLGNLMKSLINTTSEVFPLLISLHYSKE